MNHLSEPPELRRRRMLDLASSGDFARPNDLAQALGVSGETIRRDLQILEKAGRIRRVHGGVIVQEELRAFEPDRASRAKSNLEEKREIAAIALTLVSNNDAIFLDVGTTVETAAQQIPLGFAGTLITNSLIIGSLLGDRENANVQILGGRLRTGEFTTYGPDTAAQIENFNADFAFISAGGIHPVRGITDYSTDDVASRLAMIRRSREAYVLVTSDKLFKIALRQVCSLDAVTGVITDSRVTREQMQVLEDAGIRVLRP